ncbi:MAG TPA: hypothetical protein VM681_00120 [Candidatus Thermoplasmatota archaeon]|nr:hypothetical protein [Candidatus Thermoplasmatota archaeon]
MTTAVRAFSVATVLLGAAFAGCLFSGPAGPACVLNRIIDVRISSSEPVESFEEALFPSFKLTLRTEGDASRWALAYKDKQGNLQTKTLAQLGLTSSFSAGTELRVPDVALDSPGTVLRDGEIACSRSAAPQSWWTAGGVPLGLALEPGESLAFRLGSNGELATSGRDIRLFPEPSAPTLERVTASFRVQTSGDVSLASGSEFAPLATDLGPRQARNVAWGYSTAASFPLLFDLRASLMGQTVELGLELADTRAEFTAAGNVKVGEARDLLSFAADRGQISADATLYGWSSPDAPSPFPGCEGRSREDRCEVPSFGNLFPLQRDLPAYALPVPSILPMPAEQRAALEAFLAERLEVGDALSLEAAVSGAELNRGAFASLWPADFRGRMRFSMEVTGLRDVTVAAGTFPAVEIVQQLRVEASATGGAGAAALELRETLARTTVRLHRDTFVPLQVESEVPVNMNELARKVLRSIPANLWPAGPPNLDNLSFTLDGRSTLELSRMTGSPRMAPWVAVSLAYALPAFSAAGLTAVGNAFGGDSMPENIQPSPVQATVVASATDRDGDSRTDTIRLFLADSPEAPFGGEHVYVSVDGFDTQPCAVLPTGTPPAYACAEPLGYGSYWHNGAVIYVACTATGENAVFVAIRGAVVLAQAVRCDQSSPATPPSPTPSVESIVGMRSSTTSDGIDQTEIYLSLPPSSTALWLDELALVIEADDWSYLVLGDEPTEETFAVTAIRDADGSLEEGSMTAGDLVKITVSNALAGQRWPPRTAVTLHFHPGEADPVSVGFVTPPTYGSDTVIALR